MEYEAIWQAFADTGDPLYYLLYKQVTGGMGHDNDGNRPGDMPLPGD